LGEGFRVRAIKVYELNSLENECVVIKIK